MRSWTLLLSFVIFSFLSLSPQQFSLVSMRFSIIFHSIQGNSRVTSENLCLWKFHLHVDTYWKQLLTSLKWFQASELNIFLNFSSVSKLSWKQFTTLLLTLQNLRLKFFFSPITNLMNSNVKRNMKSLSKTWMKNAVLVSFSLPENLLARQKLFQLIFSTFYDHVWHFIYINYSHSLPTRERRKLKYSFRMKFALGKT